MKMMQLQSCSVARKLVELLQRELGKTSINKLENKK